jgi:hypothetical protein
VKNPTRNPTSRSSNHHRDPARRHRVASLALLLLRTFVVLGSILLAGRAAEAQTLEREELPTVVVGPPASSEYPQPICSKCQKLVVARETTSQGTQAFLSLVYDDEAYVTFDGEIELTVALLDGRSRVIVVPDVALTPLQEATWLLLAGTDWSWEDAEQVEVELVPAM